MKDGNNPETGPAARPQEVPTATSAFRPAVNPIYPGSKASVREVLDLATAYHHAAIVLLAAADRRNRLSFQPARLCAIHSIELYVNAFLRQEGATAAQVRARSHNLADEAFAATLKLKVKTRSHLVQIGERREYLIARYAPDLLAELSELTRLTSTLSEVSKKAEQYLEAALAQ